MEKKPFEYDPEVTDFTLIVENQKLHVAKAVLIDASPVFRKMLTGEFKEKNMSELELPGKKYSSFELFLRCIFPKEYYELIGRKNFTFDLCNETWHPDRIIP